jgi:hypothetical protein
MRFIRKLSEVSFFNYKEYFPEFLCLFLYYNITFCYYYY